MSEYRPRAVPKWPIINFQQVFAGIEPLSVAIGVGGGLAIFYVIQKFVLKKCIR